MATVGGPSLIKIHKKTGSSTYTLYHPQTGAEMVLYNGDSSDPDFSGLTKYDAKGDTWSSGQAYYKLSDVLGVVFTNLGKISNVLEFKGVVQSFSDLPSATAAEVGSVYIVQEAYGTYPAGTLYVCCDKGSGASPRYTWEPIGGDNTIYALKSEAIKTASLSGSTITLTYADSTAGTPHTTSVTFPTIGTTAASTVVISTTIPTDSTSADNYIPTVKAVKDFASSAGKVKEALADTGYLVGTSTVATASAAALTPVGADIKWATTAANAGTASKYMNVNITGNAETATKVNNPVYIGSSWSFDGSASRSISVSSGLTTSYTAGDATLTIAAKAYTAHGITVDSDGIGINAGNGLEFSNSTIKVKPYTNHGITVDANGVGVNVGTGLTYSSSAIALSASGVASGVYSAVQVDTYGRAVAGGQSVVFAENITDSDLDSLVVGGLAFVGNESTATDSTYTTNSSDVRIG